MNYGEAREAIRKMRPGETATFNGVEVTCRNFSSTAWKASTFPQQWLSFDEICGEVARHNPEHPPRRGKW